MWDLIVQLDTTVPLEHHLRHSIRAPLGHTTTSPMPKAALDAYHVLQPCIARTRVFLHLVDFAQLATTASERQSWPILRQDQLGADARLGRIARLDHHQPHHVQVESIAAKQDFLCRAETVQRDTIALEGLRLTRLSTV